jgi:hypothetical protein
MTDEKPVQKAARKIAGISQEDLIFGHDLSLKPQFHKLLEEVKRRNPYKPQAADVKKLDKDQLANLTLGNAVWDECIAELLEICTSELPEQEQSQFIKPDQD